jgi:hypothetical protein
VFAERSVSEPPLSVRHLSIRIESPIRTDYGSRKPSRRLDGSISQNYLVDFQLITAAPPKSRPKTLASGLLGAPP